MEICWKNRARNAGLGLVGCLVLCGGVSMAEEGAAEGGFAPLQKAVKTVKSLMNHRRQDVRAAEMKKEQEEQRKREEAEREKNVTLKDQFKLVEHLLAVRIDEMVKVPEGSTVKAALNVVRRHAEARNMPVRIVWADADAAEDNDRLKLKGEVNLYGCMASEAIAKICEAANCVYMVRGKQVELEPYGKELQVEKIPCPQPVFENCFISQRVTYDANGRKQEARALPYQRNAGRSYRYVIKEKRIGKILDFKIRGEYDPETGLLELRGTRLSLIQCRKEIDDMCHTWLRSFKAKEQGVQDTTTQRYRIDRKLNALPMVPIEFAERCTLKEVVEYLNLVASKSRIKLTGRFAAERGQEEVPLWDEMVIPHSTFLDAVFHVCDAIRGSYTVQGTKLTFIPKRLERRRYETRNPAWSTLVTSLRKEENPESRSNTSGRRFFDTQDEDENSVDKQFKRVLASIGIQVPDAGSVEYASSSSLVQNPPGVRSGTILVVEADPRTHFHLNRLFRYIKVIENP